MNKLYWHDKHFGNLSKMAFSWDSLGNAANILQVLEAIHLITVAKNFVHWSHNDKECCKLELRVDTLEALVSLP